jgi:hypothetical protein
MQPISNDQLATVLGGTACSVTAARFDKADKAFPSGAEDDWRTNVPFTDLWWKHREYVHAAFADMRCRPDRDDRAK